MLSPLQAELIAAAGGTLLLVSLLFLKWFGLGGTVGRFAPRAVATGSEGAWQTLTLLRWPALLAGAVAVAPVLVRLGHRWLGPPRRTHSMVAVLGSVTTLLLGYRVLIDLPDPSRVVDQKAGAILALLGALLIAIGGVESMLAQAAQSPPRRARRRSRRSRRVPGEIARMNA
ncbi:MAG TPA: hypothetical protein VG295_15410 [Solirubrobacteraceae bacterium]|nr:hypothetical protein [Solirubrobacteraceae bacterium]